jgi:hypothetical protein
MQWQKYQGQIDPERLVFIDETWTKTNVATLRAGPVRQTYPYEGALRNTSGRRLKELICQLFQTPDSALSAHVDVLP